MPVLAARRVHWLWLHAVALYLLAQVGIAAFLAVVDAPGALLDVHARRMVGALEPLVWIMLGMALVFGAYGRPYRWFWLVLAGGAVFQVVIGFMGYVLPWGQISFWMASKGVPGLPVMVVPIVCLGLLGLHLRQVARLGPPLPYWGRYTWGGAFAGLAGFGLIVLVLWRDYAVIWSVMVDQPVRDAPVTTGMTEGVTPLEANPLAVPTHILPKWYALPFYGAMRAMPELLSGVAAMFALAAIWLLVPWLDRGEPRAFWQRSGMRWLVPCVGLAVLGLGAMGAMPMQGAVVWIARLALLAVFVLVLVVMPLVTRRISRRSP